jgi:hypothetical protein
MKYDGTNLGEVLKYHEHWMFDARSPADRADFTGTDLAHLNLKYRNLTGAIFVNANLCDADLRWSVLQECDFKGALMNHAALEHADLRGAKNLPYIPMVCPETGSFIAWKKCAVKDRYNYCHCIVKLFIPEDALRSSGTSRKCRASKALVLEFQDFEGHVLDNNLSVVSMYNHAFGYTVGNLVQPVYAFDKDRWSNCASGIHFFMGRREAVEYCP